MQELSWSPRPVKLAPNRKSVIPRRRWSRKKFAGNLVQAVLTVFVAGVLGLMLTGGL